MPGKNFQEGLKPEDLPTLEGINIPLLLKQTNRDLDDLLKKAGKVEGTREEARHLVLSLDALKNFNNELLNDDLMRPLRDKYQAVFNDDHKKVTTHVMPEPEEEIDWDKVKSYAKHIVQITRMIMQEREEGLEQLGDMTLNELIELDPAIKDIIILTLDLDKKSGNNRPKPGSPAQPVAAEKR